MSAEPAPATRANTLPYADRVIIVGSDAPFKWLAAGWQDFRRAGHVSFIYGLLIAATGLVLTIGLYIADLAYLISPLVAGFMLVGPALTVGLYAVSRDLEAGQRPSFGRALGAWRRNSGRFLGMGLLLVAFLIVWLRFAALIFAVSFPYGLPDFSHFLTSVLFSVDGLTFLGIGTVVGAFMATIVFAVSVVSLPMLLDRDVDILQAIVTSVVCSMMNARVMAVWAAVIVIFTAVGLLTAYIGLAITLPLIGHASWHAYRSLIRPAA